MRPSWPFGTVLSNVCDLSTISIRVRPFGRDFAAMLATCSGPRLIASDGSRSRTRKPKPDCSRHRLVGELAALGDPEVTAEARRRFAALTRNGAASSALREPIAKAVAYSADQMTYDNLLRLARAGERTRAHDFTMAQPPALATLGSSSRRCRSRAATRNSPPAQILPFLERAAKESGDPDRVWRLVFADRNEILGRLSGLQRQQALSRIARASANPAVAFELKWADATRANSGLRRFADEAAEEIEFKADLKATLVPAVQQWIAGR